MSKSLFRAKSRKIDHHNWPTNECTATERKTGGIPPQKKTTKKNQQQQTKTTTATYKQTKNRQNKYWRRFTNSEWVSEWVSWLVSCALSPVNHKGLYQGWTQTSVYPLVIHSTSHYTTSLFFPNKRSNSLNTSTISEYKPTKTVTQFLEPIHIPWALNTGTCIKHGALFYSVGLHKNRCYHS